MIELYYIFYGIMIGVNFILLLNYIKAKGQQKRLEKLPEKCPLCGEKINNIPAGISKRTGQPFKEFWVCDNNDCSFTCNKRAGYYICNFEKSKSKNGRQNNEKSKTRTDEIKIEDIPF